MVVVCATKTKGERTNEEDHAIGSQCTAAPHGLWAGGKRSGKDRTATDKHDTGECPAAPSNTCPRHTLAELTPELLWTFIERIDIGERPGRYNRNGMQEVRIIYRDIGVIDSALSAEDADSTEVHVIPSLEMVVQQMTAQTQVS